MSKLAFKRKADKTISISFPATVLFTDYHEISDFASKLSQLLGVKVKGVEGENKDGKYEGIFTVA